MREDDPPILGPVDATELTLAEVAVVCRVEPAWLVRHLEAGLIPGAEQVAGRWRLTSAGVARARRMSALERDFDAVPELAALVADALEEMDALRNRLRRAGLD